MLFVYCLSKKRTFEVADCWKLMVLVKIRGVYLEKEWQLFMPYSDVKM